MPPRLLVPRGFFAFLENLRPENAARLPAGLTLWAGYIKDLGIVGKNRFLSSVEDIPIPLHTCRRS